MSVFENLNIIDPSLFPKKEHDSIYHIRTIIGYIASCRRKLFSALILFQEARSFSSTNILMQKAIEDLPYLAARDAAMTIYHLGEYIIGLRNSMGDAPTFKGTVDHELLRAAYKEFKIAFPLHRDIRHAIAHSAELSNTMEARQKNSVKSGVNIPGIFISPGTNVTMSDVIVDDNFIMTFKEKIIQYKLNVEAINNVDSILEKISNSFFKRNM